MQHLNWNDLRYLLAIQRAGTLAGAARRLGVDGTTVSRRLDALQTSLGVELYQRQGDGTLKLTARGDAAAEHVGIMEHHAGLIGNAPAPDNSSIAGTVRLTSVPIIVNRLLIPHIPDLTSRYPALNIELLPDSRDFSLTRREADLALRLSRPKTGGSQVKARRVAMLNYGVYRSAAIAPEQADGLKWISYDEAMAHLPQARWMAAQVRGQNGQMSLLRVRDGDSALEAVLAGLGKSLIPVSIGDQDKRLVRIAGTDDVPVLTRDLWLLGHAEQLKLDHIKAVTGWIDDLLG